MESFKIIFEPVSNISELKRGDLIDCVHKNKGHTNKYLVLQDSPSTEEDFLYILESRFMGAYVFAEKISKGEYSIFRLVYPKDSLGIF